MGLCVRAFVRAVMTPFKWALSSDQHPHGRRGGAAGPLSPGAEALCRSPGCTPRRGPWSLTATLCSRRPPGPLAQPRRGALKPHPCRLRRSHSPQSRCSSLGSPRQRRGRRSGSPFAKQQMRFPAQALGCTCQEGEKKKGRVSSAIVVAAP